jgi:hypothetical protein
VRPLDADARIRTCFSTERGSVTAFSIQLEVKHELRWHPVVRYDPAHGIAHRDLIHRDGSEDKRLLPFGSFADALTFAQADLNKSWQEYRRQFLQEFNR